MSVAITGVPAASASSVENAGAFGERGLNHQIRGLKELAEILHGMDRGPADNPDRRRRKCPGAPQAPGILVAAAKVQDDGIEPSDVAVAVASQNRLRILLVADAAGKEDEEAIAGSPWRLRSACTLFGRHRPEGLGVHSVVAARAACEDVWPRCPAGTGPCRGPSCRAVR